MTAALNTKSCPCCFSFCPDSRYLCDRDTGSAGQGLNLNPVAAEVIAGQRLLILELCRAGQVALLGRAIWPVDFFTFVSQNNSIFFFSPSTVLLFLEFKKGLYLRGVFSLFKTIHTSAISAIMCTNFWQFLWKLLHTFHNQLSVPAFRHLIVWVFKTEEYLNKHLGA